MSDETPLYNIYVGTYLYDETNFSTNKVCTLISWVKRYDRSGHILNDG